MSLCVLFHLKFSLPCKVKVNLVAEFPATLALSFSPNLVYFVFAFWVVVTPHPCTLLLQLLTSPGHSWVVA